MRTLPVLALAIVLLSGCQSPDVGQSCSIQTVGSVNLNTTDVPADFVEFGNEGCDDLVCIRSPNQPSGSKVKSNPYCSKPCVSNDDCFQSDTGLVCRPITVDPNFIKTLPPSVQTQYNQILGQLQFSSYCAAPLQ